ncbi:MAG: hypothetical protein JKY48_19165 [Flavobacteriales bacterium]|nr:hypothetical protein [Flavobacteriales bacterium]
MNRKALNQFTWKQHDIGFGVIIYILHVFIILYFSDQTISFTSIVYMILICATAGYGISRYMKWELERG